MVVLAPLPPCPPAGAAGPGATELVHFAGMRRAARVLGLAAVALVAASCSRSTPASAPPSSTAPAPPASAPATAVAAPPAFAIQAFDVAAAGESGPSLQELRSEIGGVLDRYLSTAVVGPLQTGQPAGDLSPLFGGGTAERVAGADRAALVDEGFPPAVDLTVERATASVTVLVGPDPEVGLARAVVSLLVRATVGGSALTVDRTGELLVSPEDDGWKISGYEIRVTRDTATLSTTTVAKQ
jgi:hypothetical protein